MLKAKVKIIGKGYGKDTEKELNQMFDYYNKELFNNKLPKTRIVWNNRFTSTIGRTYRRDGIKTRYLIHLSKKYHSINGKNELANTLLHEMIHLLHWNHGLDFIAEASRINELTGLNTGLHSEEPNSRRYYRYVVKCKHCKKEFKVQRDITNSYHHGCEDGYLGEFEIIKEL